MENSAIIPETHFTESPKSMKLQTLNIQLAHKTWKRNEDQVSIQHKKKTPQHEKTQWLLEQKSGKSEKNSSKHEKRRAEIKYSFQEKHLLAGSKKHWLSPQAINILPMLPPPLQFIKGKGSPGLLLPKNPKQQNKLAPFLSFFYLNLFFCALLEKLPTVVVLELLRVWCIKLWKLTPSIQRCEQREDFAQPFNSLKII